MGTRNSALRLSTATALDFLGSLADNLSGIYPLILDKGIAGSNGKAWLAVVHRTYYYKQIGMLAL